MKIAFQVTPRSKFPRLTLLLYTSGALYRIQLHAISCVCNYLIRSFSGFSECAMIDGTVISCL